MTVSVPLAFPGSQMLGSWWRQLAPYQPRTIWVAHLFVHRVEVPVRVWRVAPADPVELLLLDAVAGNPAANAREVAERVPLPRHFLDQVLQRCRLAGLLQPRGDGTLELTDQGRILLRTETRSHADVERRPLYFVENSANESVDFLPMRAAGAALCEPTPQRPFDIGRLNACLAQSPEWKREHGFPVDIELVTCPGDAGPAVTDAELARGIIVDRPGHLLTALIRAGDGSRERLLGFGAQPAGWSLHTDAPAFELGMHWRNTFPDLAQEVGIESWRHAWMTWAQSVGVGAGEMSGRYVERVEHRLRVLAPAETLERWRRQRPQVFRNDVWILAGAGTWRTAARLELGVIESPAQGPAAR